MNSTSVRPLAAAAHYHYDRQIKIAPDRRGVPGVRKRSYDPKGGSPLRGSFNRSCAVAKTFVGQEWGREKPETISITTVFATIHHPTSTICDPLKFRVSAILSVGSDTAGRASIVTQIRVYGFSCRLITGLVKLEPLKGFQNGAKRVETWLNRNSCSRRFLFSVSELCLWTPWWDRQRIKPIEWDVNVAIYMFYKHK